MEDFNHKTVFVLDHTQYFGNFDVKYNVYSLSSDDIFLFVLGISGENTFHLEFTNSKGMETVVPVSKVMNNDCF